MRHSHMLFPFRRKALPTARMVCGWALLVFLSTLSVPQAESTDSETANPKTPRDSVPQTMVGVPPADPLNRGVRNIAFGVGEKLSFDINYGFINAGHASMEVMRVIDWSGRPSFFVRTLANSNEFFSSIFPVRDTVVTIIDAIGVFSWRFDKRLKEGSYRADRLAIFDQLAQKAMYKSDTFDVGPFCQDALSALYFTRTQELIAGQSLKFPSFTDGRVKPLEVRVLRKERIEVEAGTFDCIVVEPLLGEAGIFRHEGRLTVWLTDDRLRLPVLMKSKVLVGAISAELVDYELGEIEDF